MVLLSHQTRAFKERHTAVYIHSSFQLIPEFIRTTVATVSEFMITAKLCVSDRLIKLWRGILLKDLLTCKVSHL